MKHLQLVVWTLIAGVGAAAFFVIATTRDEPISAAYLIVAAICTGSVNIIWNMLSSGGTRTFPPASSTAKPGNAFTPY